jgi:tetratricopeptide (TPR) repeat protein
MDEQKRSQGLPSPLTPLQEECFKLLQARQFKSCEILARIELATAEQEGRETRVAWALLGDCAQLTQQYNKAISYYRRIPFNGSHKYRLKEAQCLQATGNVVEASSVLELIPHSERNLTIHMTLGQLYIASGRTHSACECFLHSLCQNPFTLEAIESLAVVGATESKVVPMESRTLEAVEIGLQRIKASKIGSDGGGLPSIVPVKEFVMAQFAKGRHHTAAALRLFVSLEQKFPNNVYLMLKIATLQVRLW